MHLPASLSRRQLLVGAALGAVGVATRALGDPAAPAPRLKIGVATLGFPKLTHAQLATELSGAGVRLIQLFLAQSDTPFWRYNGRADVSSLTAVRAREIARIYRDAGIAIHSLGVYTNLIHPDAAERRANLDYFAAMMDLGAAMEVRTFITEAGHHLDPKGPEPRIAHHFQDEVWIQMLGTARQLAALAEQRQATVLLEGFYRGFLASAKRLRMFLEEVNSPRVRALLDPANLIEVNDLEEMFAQLAPWIDCLHAKDRQVHVEKGVPAGQGSLDYVKFVQLVARHTPAAPLILEYVGPADYRAALAHLRRALAQAGLAAD
ncbi:MAG: sugar phosphate isomerase/epimerase [Verrucomicrobia bacterium]|nr:sugar phosphate isomerase/epimerase [Verrucomicrobiota bacterium]